MAACPVTAVTFPNPNNGWSTPSSGVTFYTDPNSFSQKAATLTLSRINVSCGSDGDSACQLCWQAEVQKPDNFNPGQWDTILTSQTKSSYLINASCGQTNTPLPGLPMTFYPGGMNPGSNYRFIVYFLSPPNCDTTNPEGNCIGYTWILLNP